MTSHEFSVFERKIADAVNGTPKSSLRATQPPTNTTAASNAAMGNTAASKTVVIEVGRQDAPLPAYLYEHAVIMLSCLQTKANLARGTCCQIFNLDRGTPAKVIRELGETLGTVVKVGRLKKRPEIVVITFTDAETAGRFRTQYQQ